MGILLDLRTSKSNPRNRPAREAYEDYLEEAGRCNRTLGYLLVSAAITLVSVLAWFLSRPCH